MKVIWNLNLWYIYRHDKIHIYKRLVIVYRMGKLVGLRYNSILLIS